MKKYIVIFLGLIFLGLHACKEEVFELEDAPTSSDAAFTATPSDTNDNVINLRVNNSNAIVVWEFGNGVSAQGASATAIYPFKGDYTITVTIFTQGGSASSSQTINIAEEDLRLVSDPIITYLTGGIDSINGKTWVIDSTNEGHFGVGPNPSNFPSSYSAQPNDKAGVGLYNDRYVFKLRGFGFDMITKGEVYLDNKQSGAFPGSFDIDGDFQAPFPDQLGNNWSIVLKPGEDTLLSVSGNSFIGFNTGVSTYKILSISEDEIFMSYEDFNDPELLWYLRLVPAGASSGGGSGGGSQGVNLPIDFESDPPAFTPFNGNTVEVTNNPSPDARNNSSQVLKTVHGNDSTGGIFIELDDKLDFSTDSSIILKIWTISPGRSIKVKLEDKNDPSVSIETTVPIGATLNWIDIPVNFGALGASANTYDKLVLFPGWNLPNPDTYYIDDIRQE